MRSLGISWDLQRSRFPVSQVRETFREIASHAKFWRLAGVTGIFIGGGMSNFCLKPFSNSSSNMFKTILGILLVFFVPPVESPLLILSAGVRMTFRHLDATFPKYFIRTYGPQDWENHFLGEVLLLCCCFLAKKCLDLFKATMMLGGRSNWNLRFQSDCKFLLEAPFEIILAINPIIEMIGTPLMTGLLLNLDSKKTQGNKARVCEERWSSGDGKPHCYRSCHLAL